MKIFIDRMEAAQADPAEVAKAQAHAAASKRKWGIGGMVRKVTGGTIPTVTTMEKEKKEGQDEEPKGVQVDFYLVIVSGFPFW